MSLRILIVDDSPLIRAMLKDMAQSEKDFEVVGVASNGLDAVRMTAELKPDVVTMDVEMPAMNGLSAVGEIMKSTPTPIVMISTLTSKGADTTIEALNQGAVDFVCKPKSGSIAEFRSIRDEVVTKLKGAAKSRVASMANKAHKVTSKAPVSDKVVVIASSTGGPRALSTLWAQWPTALNVPILIVQHMPHSFTASLANRLDALGSFPCREAQEGDVVTAGQALLAPGGRHMRIQANGHLLFDDGPAIHGVRPAADHLFTSCAHVFGARTVGVVLTGMGRDGAAGALAIKESGGIVLGESEASATVYGMPKAAREIGAVAAEYSIEEMGQAVVASLTRRMANAS